MARQKWWELGQEAGQHAKQPALGNTAELADAHRGRVERQRQRLAVEVAAREHGLVVREDERVIGAGVELHREDAIEVVDRGRGGAVNLRRTTKRLGIL